MDCLSKSSNITIDKIRFEDLSELEKLFTSAFGNEIDAKRIQQRIHRVRQFYYLLYPLHYVSAWIKNLFHIYVCRVDNTVAGFLQLSHLNHTQLHLDYIAVSQKYRGYGLGTLMLRYILDNVVDRSHHTIILEVGTNNPAFSLYKRFGFSEEIQVLDFKKSIGKADLTQRASTAFPLPGLRKSIPTDWRQLYRLYLNCIPPRLYQIIGRDIHEFHPSLYTSILDRSKDYLMGNVKSQYVYELDGFFIGSLDLYSYPATYSHAINLMLHPHYEHLRKNLMSHAYRLLEMQVEDTLTATIYNDDTRKQTILLELGFLLQEAYWLMFRPSRI